RKRGDCYDSEEEAANDADESTAAEKAGDKPDEITGASQGDSDDDDSDSDDDPAVHSCDEADEERLEIRGELKRNLEPTSAGLKKRRKLISLAEKASRRSALIEAEYSDVEDTEPSQPDAFENPIIHSVEGESTITVQEDRPRGWSGRLRPRLKGNWKKFK
ncbi:hypothetical protein NX059_005819, partial [Plenodomus lindquistii]